MTYIPGDVFVKQLIVTNISGIATNLDNLPTGVLVRNGYDDYVPTIFTNFVDVGRYNISGTLPTTYNPGDSVSLVASGYLNYSLVKKVFDMDILDSERNNLLQTNLQTYMSGNTFTTNVGYWNGTPVGSAGPSGTVPSNTIYINGSLAYLYNGIARTGTTNTIQLASTEPSIDNYYQWGILSTVGGNGPNQFGLIISYSGSTQTCYMDRGWSTIPYQGTPYYFVSYGRGDTIYMNDQGLGNKAGINFNTFFQDGGNTTTNTVDKVGSTGIVQANVISIQPGLTVSVTGVVPYVNVVLTPVSATGVASTFWSSTEQSQIRYLLGMDGTATIPLSGVGHIILGSGGIDAIQIEPGVNFRQAQTIISAVIAGSSTINGNNISFYGINDQTLRLTSTAVNGAREWLISYLP